MCLSCGLRSPAVYLPKLAKADYHGALLSVTKCKSPAFVGLSGIVLQESCNTFRIITKENAYKSALDTFFDSVLYTIYEVAA